VSAKYRSGSQRNNQWTRIGLRPWIILSLVSLTLPAFAQVGEPTTPTSQAGRYAVSRYGAWFVVSKDADSKCLTSR
jgi:hypothetical protein